MAASSSSKVCWDLARATPNVLPLAEGRLLTALCDEGLQYLFAGVKANVGLRAGCHMFEISIVEFLEPPESRPPPRHFAPTSRQLLRVGFTTREAGVLMDNEAAEQVFLDSLGQISVPGSKSRVTSRLRHDQVIALVLNLDDESPEAHSLSIFRDGERVCSQPLPDSLRGKTLYPTVTFKNLTLNANLGPAAAYPLGHSMLEAAQGAEVAEGSQKPEVLFPVGLPDQGLFDFVDQFLAENSRISELSERRAVTWAEGSGLPQGPHQQKSQDRPSTNFGIPLLDDGSCHKSLTAAAPAMKRDWLLLELNNNLRAAERQKALARFSSRDFKRIAVVAVGEPTAEYKARVHEMLLREKEAAVAKERAEKPMEKPPAPQENGEPAGEGEAKDVEMKDEPAEEEKPVELTEEEKSQWFRKLNPPDLSSHTLAKCFADYSLPKEEEGFDEIRYVWQSRDDCERIMSEWVLEQKKTMRVEDLVPSSWFKEKLDGWQKQLQEWKRKQSDTREAIKRGDFAKKPRTEPAPEAEKPEEKPEEEKEEKQEESKEGEAEKPEVNEEELEVFKVEDVMDVGNGKPLFLHFVYEDWVLLNLRVELHLLLHGFRHDVADPDRLSFPERHLEFYFQRYYRKVLQLKMFGVPSNDELVQLVKDTVRINEARFLEAVLPEEEPLENFLRFTEERRRHRQCCIDAGDETAVLRFLRPNPPPPREPRHEERKGWGKKGRYEGKDGKGHDRNDRPLARSKGGPREGKGREFDQGYRSNYTRDRPRQEWRGGDQNVRVPPVRGFGDRDRGQKRPYPAPPASAYSSKPRY